MDNPVVISALIASAVTLVGGLLRDVATHRRTLGRRWDEAKRRLYAEFLAEADRRSKAAIGPGKSGAGT